MGVLRRKEVFTVITPIPGFIPRQLAIDILHSHSEVITLNPLVLSHKPIQAPQNAKTDEYYSTWYEITERIQFVPGIGKMGASTIKFNGCFHDMPWGLQTHIYAPMNVDLRNKYRIAGNQPGVEQPEQLEMGLKALGAPTDGLYLREDIEIKCNITVVGFVKAQLQKAGGEMVARIIKKAELLDTGVLQAMIEDGRLKTINPADRTNSVRSPVPPLPSPTGSFRSPTIPGSPPQSPRVPYQIPRPKSYQSGFGPGSQGGSQAGSYTQSGGFPGQQQSPPPFSPPATVMNELVGSSPAYHQVNTMPVEMAGDFYHPSDQSQPNNGCLAPPQPSPGLSSNRDSNISSNASDRLHLSQDPSQSMRWSNADSRPTSISSSHTGVSAPFYSPGLDHKGFASELPTHAETQEERREETLRKLDPRIPQPSHYHSYNPQDYANISEQQKKMQARYGQQSPRYNSAQ